MPGRYNAVQVGPDATIPAADYAAGYDYDAQGRLNRVTGPGLPAHGAVYSFVTESGTGDPLSDLIAGIAFMSDESTTVASTIRKEGIHHGYRMDTSVEGQSSWHNQNNAFQIKSEV